ncbi:MAG: hypothetical protein ACYCPS_01475 [Candidatus Saccharimonadales bacterium]
MDFTNRGSLNTNAGQHDINLTKPSSSSTKLQKGDWTHSKLFRIAQSILVLCVLIVVVGVLVVLAISDWSSTSEGSYVQDNKLQAVFLNTGQVYFGNIKTINSSYFVLTNIFYLQTSNNGSSSNSSSSSSSTSNAKSTVTLVKLGCEIHAPLDQMIINRSSVTFWENLSPSGQVAKAVSTWERENPNGQKCSDQSSAGTSGQSTPQNATNNTPTSTSGSSTPGH